MFTDRMQRQRFEQEYMLDETQAIAIRKFLYRDSCTLDTFWATINGDKNRYKLRLRFYNDQPDSPVFFEIKRRVNNCILKQRGACTKLPCRGFSPAICLSPKQILRAGSKSLTAVQNFLRLVQGLDARWLAHVAYLREAYVDPASDNVRVTLDRAVRTEPRYEVTLSTVMKNPSLPFGDRVILELKFTNRFPEWCRQLVEHFDLVQWGAAKYCEGLAGLTEFGVSHAGDFRETPTNSRRNFPAQELLRRERESSTRLCAAPSFA